MKNWFSQLFAQTTEQGRNAIRLALTFIVAAFFAVLIFAYVAVQSGSWQAYAVSAAFIGFFVGEAVVIKFARQNRVDMAGFFLIGSVCYIVLAMTALMDGIGLALSIALALVIVEIAFETLSGSLTTRAQISGFAFSIGIFLLDQFASWDRPLFATVQYAIPAIAAGTVITITLLIIKRFNNLKIATKLFVILLIPLAGLIYFSVSGVIRQSIIAADARRLETLVNLSTRVGATVHEVQKERGISALYLSSRGVRLGSELQAQRALSDQEIAKLQSALQSIDSSTYGGTFQADVKDALTRLEAFSENRKRIDNLEITADASNVFHAETIDSLLVITFQPAALNNNEVSRLSSAYLIMLQAKERAGRERANLTAALGAGQFSLSQFQKFLTISAEQETYFNLFPLYATDEQELFYKDTMKGQFVDDVASMKQTALEAGAETNIGVDAQEWLAAVTGRINLLKEVEDRLANDLLKSASDIRQSAQRTLAFFIATTIAALALGAASIFFSRATSRSLQTMTYTAQQIANGDLDQQIEAETQDEIGTLAGAFNEMTKQIKQALATVAQRAAELQTVAEVSASTSTVLETDKLLWNVSNLTKERFGLYHAHIYLMNDAGDTLVLAAGAGDAGQQMVAKNLSIPLDREQSLVARSARERRGVIVNDVRSAPDFLPNPLLPETRSELAVPMIVGDKVIGVFDIQSDQVERFTQESANIQTTLAAQIAVAVLNARSYTAVQVKAEREALVSSIGQKIQNTSTVESALQVAIRELGRAVGQETIVRLYTRQNGN